MDAIISDDESDLDDVLHYSVTVDNSTLDFRHKNV